MLPPHLPNSRPAKVMPVVVARPARGKPEVPPKSAKPAERVKLSGKLRILARQPRTLLVKAKSGAR